MADNLKEVVMEMVVDSYNRGMNDGVLAVMECLEEMEKRKLVFIQKGILDLIKNKAIEGMSLKTSVEKGVV